MYLLYFLSTEQQNQASVKAAVRKPIEAAGVPCEACASWSSLLRALLPMRLPHLAVQAQTPGHGNCYMEARHNPKV